LALRIADSSRINRSAAAALFLSHTAPVEEIIGSVPRGLCREIANYVNALALSYPRGACVHPSGRGAFRAVVR
jgi:hypothetical protein